MTTEAVIAIMREAQMPAMPVRDIGDLPNDPHLADTGFFWRSDHPTEGTVLQMREPSTFSGWTQSEPRPAPTIGQHNDELD